MSVEAIETPTMTPADKVAIAAAVTAGSDSSFGDLRLPCYRSNRSAAIGQMNIGGAGMSKIDKAAAWTTDKVGSVGFFLMIFTWTVLWTGYNIIASEVPSMHWKAFDPFPAFVAYLLISNVIQILLMPLIMVGQNVQSRHDKAQMKLDLITNQLAEEEVSLMVRHLERHTEMMIEIMKHLDVVIPPDRLKEMLREIEMSEALSEMTPEEIAAKSID